MALDRDRKLMEALGKSPATRELVTYFNTQLEKERDAYENNPATEYNRARVVVLREILDILKEA